MTVCTCFTTDDLALDPSFPSLPSGSTALPPGAAFSKHSHPHHTLLHKKSLVHAPTSGSGLSSSSKPKLALGDLASGRAFDNGCSCLESCKMAVNELCGRKTYCKYSFFVLCVEFCVLGFSRVVTLISMLAALKETCSPNRLHIY